MKRLTPMSELENGLTFQENHPEVCKLKYGEAVKQSMEMLAEEKNTIFLGYNVAFGSNAYGTLSDVPKNQKLETPLAENLMIGLAMGMSLEGFRPVLFFERHDFILIALDGIVNHLDKIEKLSKEQYKLPVIIRAVVGSKTPIDPGLQHTQDFSEVLKKLVNFPVYEPKTPFEVTEVYEKIKCSKEPALVIERRELY